MRYRAEYGEQHRDCIRYDVFRDSKNTFDLAHNNNKNSANSSRSRISMSMGHFVCIQTGCTGGGIRANPRVTNYFCDLSRLTFCTAGAPTSHFYENVPDRTCEVERGAATARLNRKT